MQGAFDPVRLLFRDGRSVGHDVQILAPVLQAGRGLWSHRRELPICGVPDPAGTPELDRPLFPYHTAHHHHHPDYQLLACRLFCPCVLRASLE